MIKSIIGIKIDKSMIRNNVIVNVEVAYNNDFIHNTDEIKEEVQFKTNIANKVKELLVAMGYAKIINDKDTAITYNFVYIPNEVLLNGNI